MAIKRSRRKRKRQRVNPQTGEKILRELDPRVQRAISRGEASQRLGQMGEKFMQKMHPHWRKESGIGYDFLAPVGKGKDPIRWKKVEVKTLSREDMLAKKVFLHVKDGHWQNQQAEEVYFVSVGGIWKANANALRRYIIGHLNYNRALRELSFMPGKLLIEISLQRLADEKILSPTNINEADFHAFLIQSQKRK